MKTNSELKNRAIDALTGNICHDALYSERLSGVLIVCCFCHWASAIPSFFGCDSWNKAGFCPDGFKTMDDDIGS